MYLAVPHIYDYFNISESITLNFKYVFENIENIEFNRHSSQKSITVSYFMYSKKEIGIRFFLLLSTQYIKLLLKCEIIAILKCKLFFLLYRNRLNNFR